MLDTWFGGLRARLGGAMGELSLVEVGGHWGVQGNEGKGTWFGSAVLLEHYLSWCRARCGGDCWCDMDLWLASWIAEMITSAEGLLLRGTSWFVVTSLFQLLFASTVFWSVCMVWDRDNCRCGLIPTRCHTDSSLAYLEDKHVRKRWHCNSTYCLATGLTRGQGPHGLRVVLSSRPDECIEHRKALFLPPLRVQCQGEMKRWMFSNRWMSRICQ